MTSISTEAYPYTVAYVAKLLNLEESRVTSLCNSIGIQPYKEEGTGRTFLSIQDVEMLRQSIDSERRGEPAQAMGTAEQPQSSGAVTSTKTGYATAPQRGNLSRTELSVIVDSVSNVKEGILRDLSQMLDDKLSGLDEVVVELIRSKSENDTLREELKRMGEELHYLDENRAYLNAELSKFKPAAFGFYRKEE